ncbi:MAG: zinc ribbon domain-containing protein [Clostridia bacterium]
MFCKQCGKENNSNDKFCKFCGAQVASNADQTMVNQEQIQISDEINGKKPKKKMNKALKRLIIALICFVAYIIYSAIGTMNDEQEQMIALVTGGNLYSYSEQTIGQAFDDYFSTQEREYFESDDGRKIVEFNGVDNSVYEDSYCLQFQILDGEEEFEAVYVGYNGTDQSYEFMSLLFDDIYGINTFIEPEVEQSIEMEEVDEDTVDEVIEEIDTTEDLEIAPNVVAAYEDFLEWQMVTVDVSLEVYNTYFDEISLIAIALEEGYNFSQLEENNLSDLLFYHDTWDLGYVFRDINGDGIYELLIGDDGGGVSGSLVSLYYLSDSGELKLAFNAGERDRYTLCNDGLIANMGSSGADSTSKITFELTPYGLIVVNDERTKDFDNLTDEFTPGVIYTSLYQVLDFQ